MDLFDEIVQTTVNPDGTVEETRWAHEEAMREACGTTRRCGACSWDHTRRWRTTSSTRGSASFFSRAAASKRTRKPRATDLGTFER